MKKSISIYLTLLVGAMLLPSAQGQESGFARVYYDNEGSVQAYASVLDADGSCFIAGEKDGNPMLLKTDSAGNILWNYRMTGMAGIFYALIRDDEEYLVAAGSVFDETTQDYDILCMKVNFLGDTLWTRIIDMGGRDDALGITSSPDGGYLVTGSSGMLLDPPFTRAVLIRLDSNGALNWGRRMAFGDTVAVARAAALTDDFGYVVTGVYGGSVFYGGGDMFIVKIDPMGIIHWSSVVRFENTSSGLDVLADGTGLTFLATGNIEGRCLLRTDAYGNLAWCQCYGAMGSMDPLVPKLTRTMSGGYLFVDAAPYGPGLGFRTDASGGPIGLVELFMNTISAMETPAGDCLFVGNGPVLGVEMTETDNPQIGLIKTDSTLQGPECTYSGSPWWRQAPVTISQHMFDIEDAGILIPGEHIRADAGLSAGYGCVAFIGATPDLPARESRLVISPNPSSGTVLLETDPPLPGGICRVHIYDAFGQCALEKETPSAGKCRMNLRFLPNGLYLVRVYTDDGSCSGRLIIRK